MRRKVICLLAVVLGSQVLAGCKSVQEPPTYDGTSGKTVVWNLEAYENLEVLTLNEDNEVNVYPCRSEENLKETIELLAGLDDVTVVQPNYSYENQALGVNDASVKEQWALENDGSFSIEEV